MEHDTMLDAENDGAGGRVVERVVGERNGGPPGAPCRWGSRTRSWSIGRCGGGFRLSTS
jgi:hypothetical protein